VRSPSLSRINRTNYAIGAILVIAAALTQPGDVSLGIAVGVALTCLNFAVLGRLVAKWTDDAASGTPSNSAVLVLPKMIGLMVAVILALKFLPIDAAAFAIGYSIFIVSIMIEAVYSVFRSSPPPAADGADETHG
jgi:hypothetical protein